MEPKPFQTSTSKTEAKYVVIEANEIPNSHPERLGKTSTGLLLDIATHALFVILVFPFFILSAFVASIHGQSATSFRTNALDQATKVVSKLLLFFLFSCFDKFRPPLCSQ